MDVYEKIKYEIKSMIHNTLHNPSVEIIDNDCGFYVIVGESLIHVNDYDACILDGDDSALPLVHNIKIILGKHKNLLDKYIGECYSLEEFENDYSVDLGLNKDKAYKTEVVYNSNSSLYEILVFDNKIDYDNNNPLVFLFDDNFNQVASNFSDFSNKVGYYDTRNSQHIVLR